MNELLTMQVQAGIWGAAMIGFRICPRATYDERFLWILASLLALDFVSVVLGAPLMSILQNNRDLGFPPVVGGVLVVLIRFFTCLPVLYVCTSLAHVLQRRAEQRIEPDAIAAAWLSRGQVSLRHLFLLFIVGAIFLQQATLGYRAGKWPILPRPGNDKPPSKRSG